MALYETTRPAPFGAETVHRIVSYFDRAGEALVSWNNNRVTRKAISKLSDRELADIGLNRGDIANMKF